MEHETQQQLQHVLYAIANFPRLLIVVVQHLQARADDLEPMPSGSSSRLSMGSSVSSEGPVTPTDKHPATLLDLLSQQTGSKRKRSITHFDGIPLAAVVPPPERAPVNRKVSTPQRLRGLEKAMRALRHHDQDIGDGVDDEDEGESDDDDDVQIIM